MLLIMPSVVHTRKIWQDTPTNEKCENVMNSASQATTLSFDEKITLHIYWKVGKNVCYTILQIPKCPTSQEMPQAQQY